MKIQSVLFVGRRNAARSIMAETCFNCASIVGWRAFSAGWQTQHRIDPLTIRALTEQGFPVDALDSKPIDIFRQPGAPEIDLCVFLDEDLPPDTDGYPGAKEYWRIANPYDGSSSPQAYREALSGVAIRISDLILSGRLSIPPIAFQAAS